MTKPLMISSEFKLFLNRYSGWIIISILCSVVVIRWYQLNSADVALSSGYSFFSMLGRLAGLVGMVLYSINFILSTRLKFLESLFGGLNRVYIAHHLIGGIALVALLIHPLSLTLRFVPDQMTTAVEFLLPSFSAPYDWPIIYGQVAFVGLVLLLVITFFVKLPYQLWLLTHKFLGLAFFFGGLHVLFIPSDVSADNFLKWYVLGLAMLGMVSFVYRTLLSRIFVKKQKYVVKRVVQPVDKVVQIVMQPTDNLLSYKPGQFIFISFIQDGINTESHPFSISSAVTTDYNDPDSIELSVTVKALGDYTSELMKLEEGTVALIEGAFGRFTNTRYKEPKQIWVAGGIGVTPFLSMAKSLSKQAVKSGDKGYEIHMFYVVRNASELIEYEALKTIADIENLNFNFYTYIGDIQNRLISADYISNIVGGFSESDLFICGPPPMMKSLKHQFMDFGVKERKIHTEEFSIS